MGKNQCDCTPSHSTPGQLSNPGKESNTGCGAVGCAVDALLPSCPEYRVIVFFPPIQILLSRKVRIVSSHTTQCTFLLSSAFCKILSNILCNYYIHSTLNNNELKNCTPVRIGYKAK